MLLTYKQLVLDVKTVVSFYHMSKLSTAYNSSQNCRQPISAGKAAHSLFQLLFQLQKYQADVQPGGAPLINWHDGSAVEAAISFVQFVQDKISSNGAIWVSKTEFQSGHRVHKKW